MCVAAVLSLALLPVEPEDLKLRTSSQGAAVQQCEPLSALKVISETSKSILKLWGGWNRGGMFLSTLSIRN